LKYSRHTKHFIFINSYYSTSVDANNKACE
jgi:hypothetical protein